MRIIFKYITLLITCILMITSCNTEGSKTFRFTYKIHYPDGISIVTSTFKADNPECYISSERGSNTIQCREKSFPEGIRYYYCTTCPLEFVSLEEIIYENNNRHSYIIKA